MAADQTYARFADLPLDELVPLTALTGDPHRYGDFAEGSYCSTCGKNSAKRARADLWMMRREWGTHFTLGSIAVSTSQTVVPTATVADTRGSR